MSRIRILLPGLLLVILGACAEKVWDPDEVVSQAHYVHPAPPSITLVTVINNTTGDGGHSALLINAHERVAFDPAGNFKSTAVPERNDLLYGMNDAALKTFYGFHARTEWHVVTQEIEVSEEIASMAYKLVEEYGAVPPAFCANSVTKVLSQIPGFETIKVSFSPKATMKKFAGLPDVRTDKIYEYD